MNPLSEIENLSKKVAGRHNSFLARRTVLVCLLVTSIVTIIASLYWVLRGHSVPWFVSLPLLVIGVASAISIFLRRKMDLESAAVQADGHFRLKDGITTALHLARNSEQDSDTNRLSALQWDWLRPRLAKCDPSTITSPFPKLLGASSAAVALAAVVLCLLPPSATVRAAEKQAEETRLRVVESKQELEDLLDELEKDVPKEEKQEAPDMDEFRKMVRKIDETGDRAEAARQFARIEQKVREASRALDQQRDEETLKLAARELEKSEDTEARKLGKKLEQKELREAAEQLKKLQAKKIDPEDHKKQPEQRDKELQEAKKQLAKMRATTKRLAAAGKQRQAANQAAGADAGANAQGGGGDFDRAVDDGKALEDMLAELDEAAQELEELLQELEIDPDAEWDENDDLADAFARARGDLDKKLRKMHGRRRAKSKLDSLRNALASAQAQCQGQFQSESPGGKRPGTGSSWKERKERDNSQENGGLAELKGQHGEGPSLSTVEDAESGSATSNRRGGAKERDHQRVAEAFVQRDDIPENLKLGVRNYFQNLQSAKIEESE